MFAAEGAKQAAVLPAQVTGKVVHAKEQRSTTSEMGLRIIEPGHWAQLPDLPQHSREYLKRADAAGSKWPLPEWLDEDSLYRLLFPENGADRPAMRVLPEWEQVHQELKKRNVTLRLLWTELLRLPD